MSRPGPPNGRPDLLLVHLYPDLLRTYGDRGNVLALVKRAEWRGFRVQVAGVTRGEPIPERANLIFMGAAPIASRRSSGSTCGPGVRRSRRPPRAAPS